MEENFGPDFITVTDEDGNDIELEFVDSLVYNGVPYLSFFPAESDDPEPELVILKVIQENGEELLSTPDSDEELNAVYDRFMEQLFAEDEDGDTDGE